uniref:Uncharacterized protein n=1 Tax=Brassica oleracea TaxID=3712 RepID=A0A3P6DMP3_BRAOL|nr:unnamed protein product [Brassica oleracea]
MIFFGLGVWQTYVVVLAISKAIRRKPYRGRVLAPPENPKYFSLDSSFPFDLQICNGLGPHLLRPYLLRQYFLPLLLLKDYLDDFQEVFYDRVRHRRRLPGSRPSSLLTS